MDKKERRDQIPAAVRAELLNKYKNTCQSCGATDVPLTLAYLIPLAEGGSAETDNLTLLCPNCHAALDSFLPREMEFNAFLYDLLNASPSYSDVVREPLLGGPFDEKPMYRPDLLAKRHLNGKKALLLIESKGRAFFRRNQLHDAIAQINRYRSIASPDITALAFPGRILDHDRATLEAEQIEVWDLDYVATRFAPEISQSPHSGFKRLYSLVTGSEIVRPSDKLLKRLASCKPGKSDWSVYQKLIRDIFEFLFTPPLDPPIWESSDLSKVNRRDLIFPNYTSDGFWKFLRDSYSADYIVVDSKNYKHKIKKPQVLQIANYLKPHGAGMFAIITSRMGCDAGCMTTLRELWAADRKLIIVLTDNDIEVMLVASGSHGEPEKVIGQVIQEFRLSM